MSAERSLHGVRVYRALPVRASLLVLMPAAVVVGGLVTAVFVSDARWIAAAVACVGAVTAYVLYGVAHTIVLHESPASIEFRSVLRTRVVHREDVRSIAVARVLLGELVVRHSGGSERMLVDFAGVADVVGWIRSGNPVIGVPAVYDR